MRVQFVLKAFTRLSLLSAGSILATVASAQAPAQDEQQHASADTGGLAEIIVTAQRRTETAQRAALAITAVPSDALTRAGVSDVTQLSRLAPALQIGSIGGTNTQFYLRGVGNFTANALSDSAISVNLDGVALANSSAIQGMFFDLERVEVLKGPQGTLYGRNATGGAINIITAKPKLGLLGGYLNAEYGNYDAVKLAGAVNVPAGEYTAVRLAADIAERDGTFSDGTGDDRRQALRIQVLTEPSASLKLSVGADYSHFGGKGFGQTLFGLDRDERIGISDPRAGVLRSSFTAASAGTQLTPLPNDSAQDNNYWGVFGQADLKTPVGTLTVIPSYRKSNVRYVSEGIFSIHDRQKSDQFTVEARLASDNDGPFSYLLGGFFLDQSVKQNPGFAQDVFNSHAAYDIDTKSYAAFGRLTYKITDEFRLTGGARYTIDDKSALIQAYRIIVLCLVPTRQCPGTPPLPRTSDVPPQFVDANGSPVPVQPWGSSGAITRASRGVNDASRTFKKLTYRLGFEWDVRPQSLLYGTFETGFKAGGFFGTIGDPVFEPETIDAFTLGLKNRFFNNRLQLNVEAFWWNYKGQQVSHFRLTPVPGGGGATVSEFVTENIGETRLRGIEVEAVARPATHTTLNATVQYLDAKRTDYVYQNPAASGPPQTGCPFALASGVYTINCTGTRAPNSSKWTINAGIEQDFVLANDGKVTFNADGHYQSSYISGIENLPAEFQDGYITLNLQLKYTVPGSNFSIGGFVNNVTDKNAVIYSAPHPFVTPLLSEALIQPRMYGVRAGVKF